MQMNIYIEYVIIDNMAFDILLLYATIMTIKVKVGWLRVISSAVFGTLFAIFSPFITLPTPIFMVIKILVAPIMMFILLFPIKPLKFLWSNLIFIAYTFVLGGSVVAILFFTTNTVFTEKSIVYSNSVPMGVFLFAILCFVYLIFNLVRYVKRSKLTNTLYKKVKIKVINEHFAEGFIDTGNTLTYLDLPVCFLCDKNIIKKISDELAKDCLLNKGKLFTVKYNTLSGQAQTVGVYATLTINNKEYQTVLAFTKNKGSQLILNGIFGGENETDSTIEKNLTT